MTKNNFNKKLIYVGSLSKKPNRDWIWINEFSNLGWKVIPFSSSVDIKGNFIIKKLKKRLSFGNEYNYMCKNLLNLCIKEKPVWIHFRLPIEFNHKIIKEIKNIVPILSEYFNDDPFSNKSLPGLYWKFRKSLKFYHLHFVYRYHNTQDFKKFGGENVYHLPPMYSKLIKNVNKTKCFKADAAFIGHWENDQRVEYLSKIVTSGLSLILHGGHWEKGIKNTPLEKFMPINPVFGKKYNSIYQNVIVGICFFSKINRDTFTRRALEIIALGGVLVCEKTHEAENYFENWKEAIFFNSSEELIQIILKLKMNLKLREKIRIAGYKKLLSSKFSITDRAKTIDFLVNEKINNEIN